jgi:hypothetical protein
MCIGSALLLAIVGVVCLSAGLALLWAQRS